MTFHERQTAAGGVRLSLSTEDLEARRPVWGALSEFWLDTELSDATVSNIARRLAASPYSLTELEDIHRREVAPVVSTNALSIAGEWAGFDSAWLSEACRNYAEGRHTLSARFRAWLRTPMIRYFTGATWARVRAEMERIRSESDP